MGEVTHEPSQTHAAPSLSGPFRSPVVAFPARADLVTQWNHQLLALGAQSRNFAMAHVAMFDAINAIQPRCRSYLQPPHPPAGADPEAAAASAAYNVLVRLLAAEAAAFEATLNASLAYRTALDEETARWHTSFAHLQWDQSAGDRPVAVCHC